jgi:hypothetical protein
MVVTDVFDCMKIVRIMECNVSVSFPFEARRWTAANSHVYGEAIKETVSRLFPGKD